MIPMDPKPPVTSPPPGDPNTAADPGPTPASAPGPEEGGPKGPEPTRYGDWERKGIAVDF